jgi:predicted nucleotidyltransferase
MRLAPKQQQIIVTTLRRYFGQNSRILLFGSRVDDNARGGDIDLYIEPELTDADQLVDARLNAMAELHTLKAAIHRIAEETGITL